MLSVLEGVGWARGKEAGRGKGKGMNTSINPFFKFSIFNSKR